MFVPFVCTDELRGDFLTAYEKFTARLETAAEGHVPSYGKTREKKSIYLTPDAIRLKDNKNRLWRQYKKTRLEYDHVRFKNAKNRLRVLTRNLRINFEKNIAQDAKLAPKKFWG